MILARKKVRASSRRLLQTGLAIMAKRAANAAAPTPPVVVAVAVEK